MRRLTPRRLMRLAETATFWLDFLILALIAGGFATIAATLIEAGARGAAS